MFELLRFYLNMPAIMPAKIIGHFLQWCALKREDISLPRQKITIAVHPFFEPVGVIDPLLTGGHDDGRMFVFVEHHFTGHYSYHCTICSTVDVKRSSQNFGSDAVC